MMRRTVLHKIHSRYVKLVWIFPRVPWKINGALQNIQGNRDRYDIHLSNEFKQ